MIEYTQNRKCIAETGCFEELGNFVKQYGSHPLIVSYESLNPVIQKAMDSIRAAGLEAQLFTDILPEPTLECMENGYKIAKEKNCDVIIGIGGGSVLDSAKAIAMLSTNKESLEDYQMGRCTITQAMLFHF